MLQQRTAQSPQLLSISSTNSSISPASGQGFQQHDLNDHRNSQDHYNPPTGQDVMKCAQFFKSLLKMRPQQSYNILDMRNLLREVLLGEQSPEEFTVKLREVTRSQDKGNLLPFLRRALPALRRSIQNGEYKDLRQSLNLDESSPRSQMPTPPDPGPCAEQSERAHLQKSKPSPKFIQQQYQYQQQQPVIFAEERSTAGQQQKIQFAPIDESMVLPQQQTNFAITQSPNATVEEPTQNSAAIMCESAPDLHGTDYSDMANPIADNLNNLPQMLLNPQALADRILERMPDAEGVDPEVLSTISNTAESRLRSVLTHLAVLADHRLEPLRINPMYRVLDEPRKQLRFMEDIEKRAHESRQTAEKEALLKITKSKGKDKDTLEKAKQLQKADREEMVNREANAAAFAALGGSRIGSKRPFAPNGGADWKQGMQSQGLNGGLTGIMSRTNRVKRVTMRDLQFFLGIDSSFPSNSKLRHRIALASLSSIDENTSL